jgi:hypothetical protein
MARDIQYRRRLLRLLSREDLEALYPGAKPDDMLMDLVNVLAHNWSPRIEEAIRATIEHDIIMARAELNAERVSNNKKSAVVSIAAKQSKE